MHHRYHHCGQHHQHSFNNIAMLTKDDFFTQLVINSQRLIIRESDHGWTGGCRDSFDYHHPPPPPHNHHHPHHHHHHHPHQHHHGLHQGAARRALIRAPRGYHHSRPFAPVELLTTRNVPYILNYFSLLIFSFFIGSYLLRSKVVLIIGWLFSLFHASLEDPTCVIIFIRNY